MPEYVTGLSGKSFRATARKIKAYKKQLEKNVRVFCEELAKEGERVIRADLATHDQGTGETLGSVKLISKGSNGVCTASVQVTSDAIMFIEFGSGLGGFGAPHDYEFGYWPGTYEPKAPRQNPDYDNWQNPEGWHYYDANGKLHWSDGIEPTFPMYKGGKEMEDRLQEVAMRVFGNV